MKKLVLVDAMALIYRSFYALNKNPRINSRGMNTSAILGFVNSLYDMTARLSPSHLGVGFDLEQPTFRKQKFADYKAHREAMPESIIISIPYIKQILQAMHIPILAVEGYEADDVIGTLAKKAERENFEVYMITPDKDYAQLVSENIFMYRPGRMGKPDEVWGVKEVCDRFEIERPEQVVDILGLWGDASDNVPGVPSIGEKKAKILIQQFGSVENLIAHAEEIQNASMKKAILEHSEQALQSKELCTIDLDVPIDLDTEALLRKDPDFNACKALFDELEFRTFSKRFFAKYQPAAPTVQTSLFDDATEEPSLFTVSTKNYRNTPHLYTLVDQADLRSQLIQELLAAKSFCFDTETTGLDMDAEIVGLAFSLEKNKGYFVPLPDIFDECCTILAEFKAVFAHPSIEKIAHNIKFDKAVLLRYGIAVEGKQFDTLLAHYLLFPEARHKLDILSEDYLSYQMIPFETVMGNATKNGRINRNFVDQELLKEYAVEDADICFQLKDILEKQLEEKGMILLFESIEMPLVDVLLAMEQTGVKIDTPYLQQLSSSLTKKKAALEEEIFELAGERFNIASPKQLGSILFERLKLDDKAKKTATKQFSTAENVLTKLAHKHEIIPAILNYRTLSKLISTYIDTLPLLVNARTKRIHTHYNQSVTATGRLSSSNPNLQNIPIRTNMGKEIRKAFIPRDDQHVLLAADYSQIELRIIASLSGDEHMIDSFLHNIDIHLATAARIYNVPLEKVSDDMRRNSKSVNFGIIYGISAFGLAEQLRISRAQAQTLIDEYFNQYPQVKNYIDETIVKARENGYAETLKGRRRNLPNINSRNGNLRNFDERNAINMPIQGTSADMIKIAMSNIYYELQSKGLHSQMILQVHDELVFDVLKSEVDQVQAIVTEKMIEALPLKVPIVVDMKTGANWLEAH